MSNLPITIDEFKEAMPAHIRRNVNPELMDNINTAIADPEILAVYRENVIGLTSVMREGKFKIDSYLNAVKYVSYKLLGDTNSQGWAKTFPDRFNDMMKRGASGAEVGSVASRYHGSKLVILMLGQTLMPTHILNAPLYQDALNKLAHLMNFANSEKVQSDSAAKLVDALKPPEIKKVELDIGLREDESIRALRQTTMDLVRVQKEMIRDGSLSVRSVAESKLIGESDASKDRVVNV